MKRAILLTIAVAFATSPLRAQSLPSLEENFLAFYSGGSASRTSSRMTAALSTLESAVRSHTAAGFLQSNGSWSDINYAEVPAGGWSPWEHVRRLRVMAQAYKTPGQSFYRSPQLRAQIEASIAYVDTFYGPTRLPDGNWWFWTIGIPLDFAPTLVLMRNDINPNVLANATATLAFRIGPNPESRPVGPVLTAQNLVWSSFNHLCLAILKNDSAMMERVRNSMSSVCEKTRGYEGMQPDNSFHQHGAQLYTGGYGGSFANDVSKYVLLTNGTTYALANEHLANFASYVADGIAWSLYGNYFDVSVISREVSRPSTTGYNGIAALLQTSFAGSPRQQDVRAATANMLRSWQWALPVELAALATSMENAGTSAVSPTGFRHYYASDYSVLRGRSFFASVKMFSTRTKSGEKTNNENLLGSRQSDGRFHLSLDGREHFDRQVWPAFDWTRLPGTTVEQKSDTANAIYGYGLRTFVGGTGNGRHGVSAMDIVPLNSQLTARKSWFFFDDAIVFLTTGITALSSNRVETIVQQWPLTSTTTPVIINGSTIVRDNGEQTLQNVSWAAADGIGYYFPSAATLHTRREPRIGSWSQLAQGGSTENVAPVPMLTLWLDHGVTPFNASASYAVVPNVTAEQMRSWAQSNPITVLANNDVVSAVRDNRSGTMGIVFWKGGSIDGYQSDRPAVVLISKTRNGVRIAAADPSQGTGTFRVTLPARYSLATSSTHIPLTRTTRSTTLEFRQYGGETTLVDLVSASRTRTVRR